MEEGEINDNSNGVFTNIQSRLNNTELKKNHEEAFLSVKQKIWSLDWYFKVIQGFNPADNNIMTDPGVIASTSKQQIDQISGLTTSSGTVTISSSILSEKDKLFLINLLFDGFVWNAKSVLDCFAHEVRCIFSLGGYSQKRKLHIDDLPNILKNNHKDRLLAKLLKDIKQKDWYKKLNKFRDITTHKNVIPKEIEYTTTERTSVSSSISRIKTREGKIFLRENPDYENSREIDLKIFVEGVYNEIKDLINDSYNAIDRDIEKEKNLPLNN